MGVFVRFDCHIQNHGSPHQPWPFGDQQIEKAYRKISGATEGVKTTERFPENNRRSCNLYWKFHWWTLEWEGLKYVLRHATRRPLKHFGFRSDSLLWYPFIYKVVEIPTHPITTSLSKHNTVNIVFYHSLTELITQILQISLSVASLRSVRERRRHVGNRIKEP